MPEFDIYMFNKWKLTNISGPPLYRWSILTLISGGLFFTSFKTKNKIKIKIKQSIVYLTFCHSYSLISYN